MKNKDLFILPIKTINSYIKNSLIQTKGFRIKKHNIIYFGYKNFMLKVARITLESSPISFKQFSKLKEYYYHINQLYINEFDVLLLCLLFKDKTVYIKINKKEFSKVTLTNQHNKIDCFQCDINIKKYIENEIQF